jgi:tetratricopeptide (TPR) repeat protein
MKVIQILSLVALLVFLVAPAVFAQGGRIEWDNLNREVRELYRTGKYDRAVEVAKKALAVAEKNVGPDHPDVATSLENLAALYRKTGRDKGAEALAKRAVDIRAIRR